MSVCIGLNILDWVSLASLWTVRNVVHPDCIALLECWFDIYCLSVQYVFTPSLLSIRFKCTSIPVQLDLFPLFYGSSFPYFAIPNLVSNHPGAWWQNTATCSTGEMGVILSSAILSFIDLFSNILKKLMFYIFDVIYWLQAIIYCSKPRFWLWNCIHTTVHKHRWYKNPCVKLLKTQDSQLGLCYWSKNV